MVVVSLVALVSERWSLSARRRAVLPLPLWEEEPPCAEVVSDALCVLSWSQGSGLCVERAVGVVQLALVSAAAAAAVSVGGWLVSAAAAARPELPGGSKGSLGSAAAAVVADAAALELAVMAV